MHKITTWANHGDYCATVTYAVALQEISNIKGWVFSATCWSLDLYDQLWLSAHLANKTYHFGGCCHVCCHVTELLYIVGDFSSWKCCRLLWCQEDYKCHSVKVLVTCVCGLNSPWCCESGNVSVPGFLLWECPGPSSSPSSSSVFDVMVALTSSSLLWVLHTWMSGANLL